MGNKSNESPESIAKEMLIAGETYDAIMSATNLRLKDIKRIESKEINPHF